MKKILLFLFTLAMGVSTMYANPKHEFRASWMTTGYGIDWPRQKTAEAQKTELQQKLDALVAGNHNAVCLQVRSFCDAIYKSSYEPWADCLTGTRGKDPGYDPLAFAIEEAHKRGLELHVWVNPFRVTASGVLPDSDLVVQNAGQWLIKYNNSSFKGQIIDPGYPEAREYVHKVLMEIVNNYDIDGILMDDYFYAYGGTNTEDADSRSKHLYKVTDADKDNSYIDDWRRANVDSVVHRLYRDLQKTKPWVRFGMGTPGNWSNKGTAGSYYGISLPATTAMESYDYLYCNPVEWAKQGWVDYLNPQVYWSTTAKKGDYDILTPWWAKKVCEHFSNKLPNGQKVHFFASQGACYVYDNDGMEGYNDGVAEIQRQIDVNRANLSSGYTGSVLFSTSSAILMRNELRESHFQYKALPPAMDWKSKTTLAAPTNVKVKDTVMTWEHPNAERFTIYIYPRGIAKDNAAVPEYLKTVVYGKSCRMDGWGDLSKLTVAIYSYDRYGVEHAAAYYEGNEVYEPKVSIHWELDGGTVDVDLPTYVTERYVLPIPTKKGYDFDCWRSVKTTRGQKITEIPAGWEGTLYAFWKNSSAVEDIQLNGAIQVYDIMGRFVGNELPTNQHGVFIIIQGKNQAKIVL
jgi:uncharacterized lipoprotein YddW (UPF0748 family)